MQWLIGVRHVKPGGQQFGALQPEPQGVHRVFGVVPVRLFEVLIPRSLEIISEINRRFLDDVRRRYPGDEGRVARVSLFAEGAEKRVRMANLAIVGTHSTNGVAEIHSELLRTRLLPDFAELFPDRFNNKTNGVTPRRWLMVANPEIAALATEAIGDAWITDLEQRSRHVHKMSEDGRNSVRQVRRDANERLKKLLKDHKVSEDDEKKGLEEVQKITDQHIKQIDEVQNKKDADLLGK